METKGQEVNQLPMYKNECNFEGYNAAILMKETAKIRMKGFSSKTLALRLKELEKNSSIIIPKA